MVTAAVGLSAMTVSAVSFSDMSNEEISALLADVSATAAAKATVAPEHTVREIPVEVTAEDLVTKVYGVIDPSVSKHECSDQVFRRTMRLSGSKRQASTASVTTGCSRKCPPWPGSVTRH